MTLANHRQWNRARQPVGLTRGAGSEPRGARPQGRPAAHPIGRRPLAALEQGERRPTGSRAAGLQRPRDQKQQPRRGQERALKQPEEQKQNDSDFLHLNVSFR